MARYGKLTGGVVSDIALADAAFGEFSTLIPDGVGIGWSYNGATFSPPPAPEPAPLTAEDYEDAVQRHLDATARGLGYDSIFTAVTYADEPAVPQFQTEGAALRAWRSLVWAYCYTAMADVQAQTRTAPTIAELIAELPAFSLPS